MDKTRKVTEVVILGQRGKKGKSKRKEREGGEKLEEEAVI